MRKQKLHSQKACCLNALCENAERRFVKDAEKPNLIRIFDFCKKHRVRNRSVVELTMRFQLIMGEKKMRRSNF